MIDPSVENGVLADTKKSVLLQPEILKKCLKQNGDSFALVYDLPIMANCLAWNNGMIALGHDQGLVTLNLINSNTHTSRNLPTKFQQENLFQLSDYSLHKSISSIRFCNEHLLAVYDDFSFAVLDHIDSNDLPPTVYGTRNGHIRDINSIDLSSNGLIATTSDDKQLLIWKLGDTSGPVLKQKLNNIGVLVKFFPTINSSNLQSDYLLLVESNNIVRVFDLNSSKFIITIYPIPINVNSEDVLINDVIIANTNLIVIGKGWWKSYSLETSRLNGGAGMTIPSSEDYLANYMSQSAYLRSETNQSGSENNAIMGTIANTFFSAFELQGTSILEHNKTELSFPSNLFIDGEVSKDGKAAVIYGSKLCLINTI